MKDTQNNKSQQPEEIGNENGIEKSVSFVAKLEAERDRAKKQQKTEEEKKELFIKSFLHKKRMVDDIIKNLGIKGDKANKIIGSCMKLSLQAVEKIKVFSESVAQSRIIENHYKSATNQGKSFLEKPITILEDVGLKNLQRKQTANDLVDMIQTINKERNNNKTPSLDTVFDTILDFLKSIFKDKNQNSHKDLPKPQQQEKVEENNHIPSSIKVSHAPTMEPTKFKKDSHKEIIAR